MNVSEEFTRVLKFIHAHRDGEVSENITRSGAQYNVNYGLSTLLLKNEARRIGPAQELAERLWVEDTRETRLMALFLLDPGRCDAVFLDKLVRTLATVEMSLQAAMTILQSPAVDVDLIVRWCKDDQMTVKLAGYNTLVRKVKTGTFAGECLGTFFAMLGVEIAGHKPLPRQSVCAALEAIASQGAPARDDVVRFVENMEVQDANAARFLVVNVLEVIR